MREKQNKKSMPALIFSIAFPVIEYWLINNLVFIFLKTVLFDNDTYNMQISAAAMAFAAFWFFQRFRLEDKGNPQASDKQEWRLLPLLVLFAVTISIWLNMLVLKWNIAELSKSYMETSKIQYSVSFLFGILLYGIISPLAEELVFRGIIQNRIQRIINNKTAIFLSAFLFALYHGNLIQGVYAFLMGLFFAVIYEKYKRIAVPIVFHAVINMISFVLSNTGMMEKLTKSTLMLIIFGLINAGIIIYLFFRNKMNADNSIGREEL